MKKLVKSDQYNPIVEHLAANPPTSPNLSLRNLLLNRNLNHIYNKIKYLRDLRRMILIKNSTKLKNNNSFSVKMGEIKTSGNLFSKTIV